MKPYAKLLLTEAQLSTLSSLVSAAQAAVAAKYDATTSDKYREFYKTRMAEYETLYALLGKPKERDASQDPEEEEEPEEEES